MRWHAHPVAARLARFPRIRGHRHAAMLATVALLTVCAQVRSPAGSTTEEPRNELMARLDRHHEALKRLRDLDQATELIHPVCSDLLLLLARQQGEPPDPADLDTSRWELFSPLWLPLGRFLLDHTTTMHERLGRLGVATEDRPVFRDVDVLTFFFLLHLLDPDEEGVFKLHRESARAYLRVLLDRQAEIRALGADIPTDVRDRLRNAPAWIQTATDLERLSAFAASLPWDEPGFMVLATEDLPGLPAQSYGRRFLAMILAGPADYHVKWLCHSWLLSQMTACAAKQPVQRAKAALSIYASLYRLLCHAGVPITVFAPADAPTTTGQGMVYHFATPSHEDLPQQFLFSGESHVNQALALQHALDEMGYRELRPLRHMLMLPLDVAVAGAAGAPPEVTLRSEGYAGYLDAFHALRPPTFLTRRGSDARGAP